MKDESRFQGQSYQAVFQARVNPAMTTVINRGAGNNIYILHRNEDIRLYGLCIYRGSRYGK